MFSRAYETSPNTFHQETTSLMSSKLVNNPSVSDRMTQAQMVNDLKRAGFLTGASTPSSGVRRDWRTWNGNGHSFGSLGRSKGRTYGGISSAPAPHAHSFPHVITPLDDVPTKGSHSTKKYHNRGPFDGVKRKTELPRFPSDRDSLGEFCLFETYLNKSFVSGSLFKTKTERYRRRNVLFTSTHALPTSSDAHLRRPDLGPLRKLPSAFVHVLKDDKEAERLRMTSRSQVHIVDRGIHELGARFYLTIVGQVLVPHGMAHTLTASSTSSAPSTAVQEWTFALDHQQEVNAIRELVKSLIDMLQIAEAAYNPPALQAMASPEAAPLPVEAQGNAPTQSPWNFERRPSAPPTLTLSGGIGERPSKPRHTKAASSLQASVPLRQSDTDFVKNIGSASSSSSSFFSSSVDTLPIRDGHGRNSSNDSNLTSPLGSAPGSLLNPALHPPIKLRDADTHVPRAEHDVDDGDTESIASDKVGATLGLRLSFLFNDKEDNVSTESLNSTASCPLEAAPTSPPWNRGQPNTGKGKVEDRPEERRRLRKSKSSAGALARGSPPRLPPPGRPPPASPPNFALPFTPASAAAPLHDGEATVQEPFAIASPFSYAYSPAALVTRSPASPWTQETQVERTLAALTPSLDSSSTSSEVVSPITPVTPVFAHEDAVVKDDKPLDVSNVALSSYHHRMASHAVKPLRDVPESAPFTASSTPTPATTFLPVQEAKEKEEEESPAAIAMAEFFTWSARQSLEQQQRKERKERKQRQLQQQTRQASPPRKGKGRGGVRAVASVPAFRHTRRHQSSVDSRDDFVVAAAQGNVQAGSVQTGARANNSAAATATTPTAAAAEAYGTQRPDSPIDPLSPSESARRKQGSVLREWMSSSPSSFPSSVFARDDEGECEQRERGTNGDESTIASVTARFPAPPTPSATSSSMASGIAKKVVTPPIRSSSVAAAVRRAQLHRQRSQQQPSSV